ISEPNDGWAGEVGEFCRYCGASIPHREGEGRCPKCAHHADPALRDFIRDTPYSEPNDGWATEKPYAGMQVNKDGLVLKYTDKDLDDTEAATIERCAEVVLGLPGPDGWVFKAAAAIRALKEKP
ncbi:MAG: hypothetical protein ACM3IH_03360, partial [Sphingobacteriales bacterium]